MKRASYRESIKWIAYEDDPCYRPNVSDEDREQDMTGLLTVSLVADMFGVPSSRVARDVIRVRSSKDWQRWFNNRGLEDL